jgi:hypothetical protein
LDPKNIEAMQYWTHPNIIKNLRGFLGLTDYYRKFVRNYGNIAAPLTPILKNNYITWNLTLDKYFKALKEAMCTTSFLALPDCTKTFFLECDASGRGIRFVLMQEGIPLAFTRKQLSKIHLGQSVYEKEMLVILHAMDI